MKRCLTACLFAWIALIVVGNPMALAQEPEPSDDFPQDMIEIDTQTVGDVDLTMALARLDTALRVSLGIEGDQTAVGLVDMNTGRFAMLRADTQYYAASVPKIAILLAFLHEHRDAPASIDADTRHELGLMIKRSDNALAAKYSKLLGLKTIAEILTLPDYKLYDPMHGGGLWVGKHYGKSAERNRDPLAGESHAATVRQLLRYYLMLEQKTLINPEASEMMREIFESPGLDHLQSKFILGLAGRDVQVIRKSGTWNAWHADTVIVTGEGRHYILVSLTHHEKGADYLIQMARSIDDWATLGFEGEATIQPATQPEAN